MELVKLHTIEDCDCLIWQRGCANKHPVWNINGKPVLLRRALWIELNGPIPAGQIIRVKCGNLRCLNTHHFTLTTYRDLALSLGPQVMGGLVRSANVAKAKRSQPIARLNWDLVHEIRTSTETGAALARRMKLPQPLISRVRLHKGWKEYSNPFTGLGART
jgi:hypothetical protein